MAEHSGASAEAHAAEAVARAGLITSIIGAGIMLVVLIGNLFIISLRHVPPSWLAVIVQVGPPFVALLGFIGTGSTWYGRWRIIRQRARYDVREDLADQALNAPGDAQRLPGQLGCATVVNPLVLALGVLLCLATFGPEPVGFLGVAQNGANQPLATPTVQGHVPTALPTHRPTATTTPRPTPTTAPTATAIPPTPVVVFTVKPASGSAFCINDAATYQLILDNTGSTTAVDWQMKGIANWATASAMAGSVPAGKTARLSLTITNCANIPINSFVDEQGTITLTSGGKGSRTFAVRIFGQRLT